ncbi:MAG: GNAT family N-acetyltransferase [Proteobacteria bacterium]|nr:GNAT family N-acetyltransferase [Pseudomonadota bacterium]
MTASAPGAAAIGDGPVWQAQSFDTEVLGAPVGRVLIARPPASAAARDALAEMAAKWRKDGIWLVSSRIPAEWSEAAEALESVGFLQVEELVTWVRSVPDAASGASATDAATAKDSGDCVEIARSAFRFDRYHADSRIGADRAGALKAAWVRNSLAGRADVARVVRDDGRARGFVLCRREGGDAVIDLIAVAPDSQGSGVGRRLVFAALDAYAGRVAEMRASTQATNQPSAALYRKAGFAPAGRARTFHWVNESARG